jgi:Tfp pilus assembly protein PilF
VSLEQSASYLERAITIDAGDVTSHLELARTYAKMGRRDDVRAELRKAIDAPVRERLDAVQKEEAARLLAELD